jgi:hypothetical protein
LQIHFKKLTLQIVPASAPFCCHLEVGFVASPRRQTVLDHSTCSPCHQLLLLETPAKRVHQRQEIKGKLTEGQRVAPSTQTYPWVHKGEKSAPRTYSLYRTS